MSKLNCKHERFESHVYREGLKRHTYFQCFDCGAEKTVTETVNDLSDSVTSEEQIAVHEALAANKTLAELIK